MKKSIICLLGVALTAGILAGCGTSFAISSSDLEAYANENDMDYEGMSPGQFEDFDTIDYDGVYGITGTDCNIELLDCNTSGNASLLYEALSQELENMNPSSHVTSQGSDGSSYACTIGGDYYRVLFSGDKVIYAFGEKDSVKEVLVGLGVMDK